MGTDITTIIVIIPMVPPDGISESASKKSGLTSKKQHNGKEKHSVHTEDEA